MTYFLNPFDREFRGNLILSDRQFTLTFAVPASRNTSFAMMAWQPGPYDVSSGSGQDTLTLNFSFDNGRHWTVMAVDVSAGAVSAAAATAFEVVAALNADDAFAALFTAVVQTSTDQKHYVYVKANRQRTEFRCYISLTEAEKALRFNKMAGVAEMPTYFARHTIANVLAYNGSEGMLIALDPLGDSFHAQIVDDAGQDSSAVQEDWQLLRGRSGAFSFQKITVDGSDRISEIIEYSAGAGAGDLSKKTIYTYAGGNKNPDQITEIPYTLEDADLVTP